MIVRDRLSIDEYMQRTDAGEFVGRRVQLLRGEVIELSPQNEPHADVIQGLNERLVVAFRKKYWIRCQIPMVVEPDSMPEPDFAIIPKSLPKTGRHPRHAVAVNEVSDTTLRQDRGIKRQLYAEAGVPEYWIINLSEEQIEIYREPLVGQDGVGYASEVVARGEEEVRFLFDPSVTFVVGQVLRGECAED